MAREIFPVKFKEECYDLQKFLRDHPGGVNTLQMYKGKSILQAMQKFGHSTSAYHLMKDLKVDGDVLKDVNLTGGVSENGRILTNEDSMRDPEEIEFLEQLESRLDWSKPLLCQLHAIAPDYEKWVNSAVYRKCRLFASPLLESLTYTPWYFVPMFWIPVILYLGWTQYYEQVACGEHCTDANITTFQYVYYISLGVLLWTILEYSLHRWIFHLDPGSSLIMIKLHFLIHGMHHKVPFDGLRQVFPPIPALGITTIIYSALRPFLPYPVLVLTGGLIGYLTYDMIHYYVHHGSPKDGTYLYAMKRYHSNHHFLNHDKAYGISSKMWDHVFRTVAHVKKLSFSLRW
ncbi:fatty acid 2-hydroxylase [Bombyx mori]|uniref:Fatty acid 2-hydroxylase n=1 Tax=Bombyx mori TaxID=7091 RepID=A0A8R2QYF9_BOMMO|nr:fatty acid 2-hydroxylase [Bombyx mori]